MDAVERGEFPPLGNGFSFVTDRRPPGSKSQFIPPVEYTTYFSRREVPIADVSEPMYPHDVSHMPGYILMFANAFFADTVAIAAQNALTGPEGACQRFTEAIDGLGDNLYDIMTRDDEQRTRISDVESARHRITTLIELATDTTDHAELLATIEQGLGLDYYRQIAVDEVGEPVYDEPIYSSHSRLTGGVLLRAVIDQTSRTLSGTVKQAAAGILKITRIKAFHGK